MNIQKCPHCLTNVVPSEDGSCPSCQFNVNRELTQEEAAELHADRAPTTAEYAATDVYDDDRARQDMLAGAMWCIGGIVVTAVTYAGASGGGTYVVAWGAIVFGAVQFFRGMLKAG